mmetsp:Transcript_17381/g.36247  ORF Transcript_17381/g.36247 Transcript_17381/m.36247 type:complete len:226 (+) Transcript_17381:892-1569(+)
MEGDGGEGEALRGVDGQVQTKALRSSQVRRRVEGSRREVRPTRTLRRRGGPSARHGRRLRRQHDGISRQPRRIEGRAPPGRGLGGQRRSHPRDGTVHGRPRRGTRRRHRRASQDGLGPFPRRVAQQGIGRQASRLRRGDPLGLAEDTARVDRRVRGPGPTGSHGRDPEGGVAKGGGFARRAGVRPGEERGVGEGAGGGDGGGGSGDARDESGEGKVRLDDDGYEG